MTRTTRAREHGRGVLWLVLVADCVVAIGAWPGHQTGGPVRPAGAAVAPSGTATPFTPTPTVHPPTPLPSRTPLIDCVGDCTGSDRVSAGDLVTLVSIALGNLDSDACPYGNPGGGDITVGLIISAVNNARQECPSG